MSFRSSAGWFWPSFEEAAPPAPRQAPAAAPRADRWARPAPAPAERPTRTPEQGTAPAHSRVRLKT